MEKALRYNTGKPMWRFLCPDAMIPMIDVLTYGAHKYTVFQNVETSKEYTGMEITQEQARNKTLFKVIRSGSDQWKDGLSVTECFESLQRHLYAFMDGENNDKESGLNHLGHAMCNLMFMTYMTLFKPEFDDRTKPT
jgi:hypothetical protein